MYSIVYIFYIYIYIILYIVSPQAKVYYFSMIFTIVYDCFWMFGNKLFQMEKNTSLWMKCIMNEVWSKEIHNQMVDELNQRNTKPNGE